MKQNNLKTPTLSQSRRDFLKLATATSAGMVTSASVLSLASGQQAKSEPSPPIVDDLPGLDDQRVKPVPSPGNLRRNARFLVDVHVHVGIAPSLVAVADSIHSSTDWVRHRSENPQLFAKMFAEAQIDNSDRLIEVMDGYGVTHAVIQPVPRNTSLELVANAAKKHKGRFFPLYRPVALMNATASGKAISDAKALANNAREVAADIEKLFPALGFIGVGEVLPGGLVTTDIDPAKISRDMGPIMEALQPRGRPILFPTGSTAFKGNLYYLYNVLWVDELAGNFPQVPIVLTKMGRGLPGCFDMCLVVAMRNANVFLDLTDSTGEHVREAINRVSARRIMFGTDLMEIARNYAYDVGAQIVREAKLSDDEWEWIAWRTANEVFRLGL
jgi:predicted TIM-barrel fold metal-dependent hydrolase